MTEMEVYDLGHSSRVDDTCNVGYISSMNIVIVFCFNSILF